MVKFPGSFQDEEAPNARFLPSFPLSLSLSPAVSVTKKRDKRATGERYRWLCARLLVHPSRRALFFTWTMEKFRPRERWWGGRTTAPPRPFLKNGINSMIKALPSSVQCWSGICACTKFPLLDSPRHMSLSLPSPFNGKSPTRCAAAASFRASDVCVSSFGIDGDV